MKNQTRKWVLPLCIIFITIFTGIAIWLQFTIHIELSATLITCFFGFFGGSLFMLASVEKAEIKHDAEIEIASRKMGNISDEPIEKVNEKEEVKNKLQEEIKILQEKIDKMH